VSGERETIGSERIEEFLERLGSDSPTPGGGAVAALAAAAGASLVSMVAALTVDKPGYEDAWDPLRRVAGEMDAARGELLGLADRDAEAFDAVMAAFRLPKGTDAEKAARAEAIQRAFAGAADVPMLIAERSAALIPAATRAVRIGNDNASSDGVSAAYMLLAAVECAAANVEINASALKDKTAKLALRSQVARVRERAREEVGAAAAAFSAKAG
jgi:formiminotetrahydrofolate cyclodeaminase